MSDLKSKKWIVAKGIMFAAISLMSASLLLIEMPTLKTIVLLSILVWASCRFYYFLFYVLENYVDSTMRYAGIIDLLMGMRQRRKQNHRITNIGFNHTWVDHSHTLFLSLFRIKKKVNYKSTGRKYHFPKSYHYLRGISGYFVRLYQHKHKDNSV